MSLSALIDGILTELTSSQEAAVSADWASQPPPTSAYTVEKFEAVSGVNICVSYMVQHNLTVAEVSELETRGYTITLKT